MRRGRRASAVALAAVLCIVPALSGCGDDDDTAATTTTGTPGDGVTGNPIDTQTPEAQAVEERGEPTIEPVEGPYDELQVIDEVEGTGDEVPPGGAVTAHYVGALAETGEVFDKSWGPRGPATFTLDQVIPGWTEGLVGMKAGGRRMLVIPPEMAYGSNPPSGSGIPPDSALVFIVDLIDVPT
jgi:FKBP-type peptidyl-prolyl cis-trans isomerase